MGSGGIKNVPKGCMAIMVGREGEEEELQRFIIPIMYVNHPLFINRLKQVEDEYGFEHNGGPITIPCHVEEFKHLQGLIHQERHNHHHHHNFLCFKA